MSEVLLQTKLFVPQSRPGLVLRPYLQGKLNAGPGQGSSKLTLVSAPAGFGKTTLIADWIRRIAEADPAPATAWLSLDENDNDPIRFWGYLIAALQRVAPGIGRSAQEMLRLAEPPALRTIITALLNDTVAAETSLVLVLDDYHHVTASSVHESLTFLLDHLPSQMHLVLITRADPPLPLARLRLRGQLTEIRSPDLRFTEREVRIFLRQTMGLDLPTEAVAALKRRTEGWVAGLQAAALSLEGQVDALTFIEAFSGRHPFVLDYLVEEVLTQQPEPVRHFLLQTSILDRLTPELCDAITGRNDGAILLARLHRANLFLVPLDDEHTWYRYHHLFAEVLRGRLRAAQPGQERILHRRAAEWYRAHDLALEAMQHALAAGDETRAAEMIAQFGERMWSEGRANTLLRWLEALPQTIIRSQPYLALLYAWALWLTGRWRNVPSALLRAEAVLRDSSGDARLRGIAAAIHTNLALIRNNPDDAVQYADHALQTLPPDDLVWRSIVAQALAHSYRLREQVAEAVAAYEEAIQISHTAGNLHATLTAVRNLAELQYAHGQLHRAAANYRRALDLAARAESGRGASLTATGNVHIWLGRLLHERYELDDAQRHLEEGIAICARSDYHIGLVMGYAELAQVHRARGAEAAVWEALAEAETVTRHGPQEQMRAYVATVRALLYVLRARDYDDVPARRAAARWAEEKGLTPAGDFSYLSGVATTYVRLLLVQDRPADALQVVEGLLPATEAVGRINYAIRLLLLAALARQLLDEAAVAQVTLRRALELAQPERIARPFVEGGTLLGELLGALPAGDLSRGAAEFAQFLQQTIVASAVHSYLPPRPVTTPPVLDAFTGRELDVLRLLASGKTNKEIAQTLTVAVSTVKTHLNSIYRKLDVHSRTEALARLRELSF